MHDVVQTSDCIVGAATWAKPVRTVQKILLVHRFQHLAHRLLNQLVFERADSYRTSLALALGNMHTSD